MKKGLKFTVAAAAGAGAANDANAGADDVVDGDYREV